MDSSWKKNVIWDRSRAMFTWFSCNVTSLQFRTLHQTAEKLHSRAGWRKAESLHLPLSLPDQTEITHLDLISSSQRQRHNSCPVGWWQTEMLIPVPNSVSHCLSLSHLIFVAQFFPNCCIHALWNPSVLPQSNFFFFLPVLNTVFRHTQRVSF